MLSDRAPPDAIARLPSVRTAKVGADGTRNHQHSSESDKGATTAYGDGLGSISEARECDQRRMKQRDRMGGGRGRAPENTGSMQGKAGAGQRIRIVDALASPASRQIQYARKP